MSLLHTLRIVICFLLIFVAGVAVANANYNWQNFESLLENGQYTKAIEQLDAHLESSRAEQNDEEWTLCLLRGAKIRTFAHQHGSAINYLLYNDWPVAKLSQSILNLALAKEYEAYYHHNTTAYKAKASDPKELVSNINSHYEQAYQIAFKNNLQTQQAQAYLTAGGYPATVRSQLSDVIAAYWLQFLADESYWTKQQKQLLSSFKLSELLDVNNSEHSNIKHPLSRVKKLSHQLILQHQQLGNDEEAFEAKRFYTQLLTRYFDGKSDIVLLSRYLTEQLKALGTQYPWWTMGQFQLAKLQKRLLTQRQPLTHIHNLAVQASIIHPDSLGSIKSRELIDELEMGEFTITGSQTSDLNRPSIAIQFRNLQKLYFKAWKTTQPLPTKSKDLNKLLARKADKEWIADLPDRFDLRERRIQHTPAIDQYGQWLIIASPQEDFQEAAADLQLLSMQFTRFVASVSYFNNEFKVSVYHYDNGLPQRNVPIDLLKIENGAEKVLSSEKTDRRGNAILRRQTDADYFRIRVGRGNGNSTIDIPALLPMKDEASWTKQRARSLIITDKDSYVDGDTLFWSVISRAESDDSYLDIKANSKRKAWVRLLDQNNNLLLTKRFTTDASGTASGNIELARQNYPKLFSGKVFRIEASWGGQKVLNLQAKSKKQSAAIKPSIKLLATSDYHREGESFVVEGVAQGCHPQGEDNKNIRWSLKRTSSEPAGALHSYSEIDQGRLAVDKLGRFDFKTQLLLGEDRAHRLKHLFTLTVECHDINARKVSAKQALFHHDKKSYYSVSKPRNFFIAGEANALELQRSNVRSIGETAESNWYIYERLPSTLSNWMRGVLKQVGTVSHDRNGKANLALNRLEAGLYRLRVIPKNTSTKQAAFEYDFLIAKAGVSKNLKLPSVLLTETSEFDTHNPTLRILAGSGTSKQWTRLTITRGSKQLANQMLSPGIHLLTFPLNAKHQGGVHFLLEWVGKEGIAYQEVNLEVPWTEKRLALSLSDDVRSDQRMFRLKVSDHLGQSLQTPETSKVLLYFREIPENYQGLRPVNFNPLYWQSRSSVMRLDNNGKRYAHYFSGGKHFPKTLSDQVELPQIRYSSKTHELLNSNHAQFAIPALNGGDQSKSLDAFIDDLSPTIVADHRDESLMHLSSYPTASHFSESFLDATGGLDILLPRKFRGKRVQINVIVVTPDLKTGQLSVNLR